MLHNYQVIPHQRVTTFCSALVALLLAACGGGDSNSSSFPEVPPPEGSVITDANYVDVAGVVIVATTRLQFVTDVIDAAFETAIQTRDVAGTYPCLYSGTVGYTKSGSTYIFTVNNCETLVGGRQVLLQSGSLRVDNPVVQTTSAGYFLTSAIVTFDNAKAVEAGATSMFDGSASISSNVISPTSAVVTTTGASLTVERAGRTDNYTDINVTGDVTLTHGNLLTSGTLTLSSPRAPGVLLVSAAASTWTATAADNSKSILSTTDYVNYTLQFVMDGSVEETSAGTINSGPLAQSITAALQ